MPSPTVADGPGGLWCLLIDGGSLCIIVANERVANPSHHSQKGEFGT